jgi:MbtH protein
MSDEYPDWQDGLLKVVVNLEEQYSVWPAQRENPPGWRDAGKTGTKAECLEYIGQVWTDMRPLSVRHQMQAEAGGVQKDQGAVPQ